MGWVEAVAVLLFITGGTLAVWLILDRWERKDD